MKEVALRLANAIDKVDHLILREDLQDQNGNSEFINRYVSGEDHQIIVEALRFYAAYCPIRFSHSPVEETTTCSSGA